MKAFLRLTPGATESGLITFRLALWVDGKERAHWPVNSGTVGAQTLRTYSQSTPGRNEPIPEGKYGLGKIEWKGGAGNWEASWGPGLGPVWISIFDPLARAFGVHLDSNRANSPGSAGCVVFATRARMESFLAAFAEFRPDALIVDYGFGTVSGAPKPAEQPKSEESAPSTPVKEIFEVSAHGGKLRARWGSGPWQDLDSLTIRGDYRK